MVYNIYALIGFGYFTISVFDIMHLSLENKAQVFMVCMYVYIYFNSVSSHKIFTEAWVLGPDYINRINYKNPN